ncbi:tau of transcription factor TFIIIC [Salix suchowensis]|nr:tau of transcription factor TFIIIC [Salix suchowensis]
MADYQYQPNPSDSLVKLRHAMETMDSELFLFVPVTSAHYLSPGYQELRLSRRERGLWYRTWGVFVFSRPRPDARNDPNLDPQLLGITEEQASTSSAVPSTEGPQAEPIATTSNLRMFPPPVFSRQLIPINYGYKANPASVVSSVVDEKTGEEKKRLINRMRWKGLGPASIMFQDEKVPDKPPQLVEAMRSQMDGTLLQKMQEYFAVRPIWTRHALMNQFSVAQAREIVKYVYIHIADFWKRDGDD